MLSLGLGTVLVESGYGDMMEVGTVYQNWVWGRDGSGDGLSKVGLGT